MVININCHLHIKVGLSIVQHFNVVAETYKADPSQKRLLLSGSGFQLQPN